MIQTILTLVVFIGAYVFIASERIHKTIVALIAAVVLIVLGIVSQAEAFASIDFGVIFILISMMVIANIMRKTGLFQWLAIKCVKIANAGPLGVLVLISLVTAGASAVLPNVAAVVLMVPVVLFVADTLDVDPKPFLISVVFASNIGGTATLIGDPPNIMIGSAAGLSFNDFLLNLAPISIIILAVYLALVCLIFRKSLIAPDHLRALALKIDEAGVITDPVLLRKSAIVLALTIVGFLFSRVLGLEVATIALGGAGLLLLWSGESPEEALATVEWSLLIFFVGLFILVEALVKVGVIDQLANMLVSYTSGNVGLASMAILWMSAILSGIIDNIPYTAAMLPFVKIMGEQMAVTPLWWSLALGACLGGNLTAIAASANVFVVDVAKKSGHTISFKEFLLYGIPVTIGSMIICSVYIWLRYLM